MPPSQTSRRTLNTPDSGSGGSGAVANGTGFPGHRAVGRGPFRASDGRASEHGLDLLEFAEDDGIRRHPAVPTYKIL
jgi:hypothetical protein